MSVRLTNGQERVNFTTETVVTMQVYIEPNQYCFYITLRHC